MSVLIKGMKMPKDCNTCQFHGFGGYKNEWIVCSLTGHSERDLSHIRDCPLIEVPPHGRLIDAVEVYKFLSAYYHHRTEAQHEALREALGRVPTIIKAEEGEEA